LVFDPGAIGDGQVGDGSTKSGRLRKIFPFGEYRIGCSDNATTERALAGPFRNRQERSSAGLRVLGFIRMGFLPRRLFEAARRFGWTQAFWIEDTAV